jgi:hypothetical protein
MMIYHRRFARLPVLAAFAAITIASSLRAEPHNEASGSPVQQPKAAFNWIGTFQLYASGFPNGQREATLTISRADTGYSLRLIGPPGQLLHLSIYGDTAHLEWSMGDGGTPMHTTLGGAGDSLAGEWSIGPQQGHVTGYRRT